MELNEGEVLRDIVGLEGIYAVTSTGRIWSYKWKGFWLAMPLDKNGYSTVNLVSNNKRYGTRVHRFVAKTFIPNPKNKPQVNHINGIKTDNRVENLEWCTNSENIKHAYVIGLQSQRGEKNAQSKLKEKQVLTIRDSKKMGKDLAKEFGMTKANISLIINRKTWTHI